MLFKLACHAYRTLSIESRRKCLIYTVLMNSLYMAFKTFVLNLVVAHTFNLRTQEAEASRSL